MEVIRIVRPNAHTMVYALRIEHLGGHMSRIFPEFTSRISSEDLARLWAGEAISTTHCQIEDSKGLCPIVFDGELRDEDGNPLSLEDMKCRGCEFSDVYDVEFDEETPVARYDGFILDHYMNWVMFNPYVQWVFDGWHVFSEKQFKEEARFKRR